MRFPLPLLKVSNERKTVTGQMHPISCIVPCTLEQYNSSSWDIYLKYCLCSYLPSRMVRSAEDIKLREPSQQWPPNDGIPSLVKSA